MNIPKNHVVIRDKKSGGVEMLLDGYDLAPHAADWEIRQGVTGEPELTVTIRCSRIETDVAEKSPVGPVYTTRPMDPEELARRTVQLMSGAEAGR